MPPKIVGYSRVASGCDYCLVAAGQLYHTDQLMPIHEHCTCGVEPVFEDSNDPRSFHAPEHALPDSELGARIDQTADITAQVEELNAAKPLVWEPGKMSVEDFLAKGGKIEDLPKGLRPKPVEAGPEIAQPTEAATASTEQEMVSTLSKHYDLSELTYDQEIAWNDYIGTGASKMNSVLRGSKAGNTEIDHNIAELQSAMKPTPIDTRVYRGISTPFDYTFGAKPEVGGIIQDKGFVSTSVSREQAHEFAVDGTGTIFDIEVPKGSDALFVGGPEGEMVLPAGSEFEITEVKTVTLPDGFTAERIKLRLVKGGKE